MIKFLLSLCIASALDANIITTKNVEDILPSINEETWLLVDLDNCMFQASQAYGHANWFYDVVQQKMQTGMSREDAIADAYPEWIKAQNACRVQPLQDAFVPILSQLQQKKVVIMGLTHRQPSVAQATLRQVESLGFDFQITAPSKEEFCVAAQMPTLYTHGILFVSDCNKKIDVFQNFLSALHQKPKKIVFIDDKRKNVEELETLQEYGIEYVGVHYTAIEHVPPMYYRELAEFQAKFLDQIMSNEAALLLMKEGLN